MAARSPYEGRRWARSHVGILCGCYWNGNVLPLALEGKIVALRDEDHARVPW